MSEGYTAAMKHLAPRILEYVGEVEALREELAKAKAKAQRRKDVIHDMSDEHMRECDELRDTAWNEEGRADRAEDKARRRKREREELQQEVEKLEEENERLRDKAQRRKEEREELRQEVEDLRDKLT